MKATPTQNRLSGRATGALFFSGFGTIWIALGLYVRELLNALTIMVAVIGLVVLMSAIVWLFRQAKHFPIVKEDPAISRAFIRINALQWIAVAIVAFTLGRLHMEVYIVSSITAIVGLHLFPLARVFGYRLHYVTAIALVVWAGLGLLVVPVEHLQGTTALGTGVILWISAATTLWLSGRTVRQSGHKLDADKFAHSSRLCEGTDFPL